jgi:hypothetical protein
MLSSIRENNVAIPDDYPGHNKHLTHQGKARCVYEIRKGNMVRRCANPQQEGSIYCWRHNKKAKRPNDIPLDT